MLDYSYSVARIRTLETKLLTDDVLSRISSQTRRDAEKQLADTGYGDGVGGTYEELAASEASKVRKLMKAMLPENLYSLLLLPADSHNLKVILKSIVAGTDYSGTVYDNTVYDIEIAAACARGGEYSLLSDHIATVLNPACDVGLLTTPFGISTSCDRAFYGEIAILAAGAPSPIAALMRAQADHMNYLAYLRARKVSLQAESFSQVLLPGGQIPGEVFTAMYAASADDVKSYTFGYDAHEAITAAQTASEQSVYDAAVALASYERKILEPYKYDTESPMPIFLYFKKKQAEATAVRRAFADAGK